MLLHPTIIIFTKFNYLAKISAHNMSDPDSVCENYLRNLADLTKNAN